MVVRLIYETHSTTVDNETGFATGWLPGLLSPTGREQARQLGERRRDDGVGHVWVSDLARAVETATIAFAGSPIPVTFDARLRECNYGDLNGAPVEALRPRTAYLTSPFPAGQSYRDVVVQMQAFLTDLASQHDRARVLVIGHSATRWALEALLHGASMGDLVEAPFAWKPGWEFVVPTDVDRSVVG